MAHFNIFAHNSALLIIDMQEAFLKVIPDIAADQACGKQCDILAQAAQILSLPTFVSEQYPKGLGHTLADLQAASEKANAQCYEKSHFSCADDQNIKNALADSQCENIIICGIEAHVCVLSTCTDLVDRGYNVIVAADAVASRKAENCSLALQAMQALGALVIPVESIVLRLQRQSGTDSFKALSKLIR